MKKGYMTVVNDNGCTGDVYSKIEDAMKEKGVKCLGLDGDRSSEFIEYSFEGTGDLPESVTITIPLKFDDFEDLEDEDEE